MPNAFQPADLQILWTSSPLSHSLIYFSAFSIYLATFFGTHHDPSSETLSRLPFYSIVLDSLDAPRAQLTLVNKIYLFDHAETDRNR